MFFSTIKGINRLISKGISNIFLLRKTEVLKDFRSLKNLPPGHSFLGAPTYALVIEF